MSLHYSEYNPSNENKENTRVKKGVTRKRRCKLEATKIKNLLNSFEGLENESSNLADFNPPPKPELTKIKNQSSDTPKTDTSKAERRRAGRRRSSRKEKRRRKEKRKILKLYS